MKRGSARRPARARRTRAAASPAGAAGDDPKPQALWSDLFRQLLTLPAPPDPYRRPLQLPRLPPGVAKAGMAMDSTAGYPNAGFLNANSIAGLNAFGLYFAGYPYLAELAQRSEYRQPVETTAKELTRKWIALKSKGSGDKTQQIQELEDAFTQFDVQAIVRKACEHDGFYGLGHVFIKIKGQEDHAAPLLIDEKTIERGSLLGFLNIEPMWTTPLVWNSTDPTLPNFYKPDAWMVLGRETHHTRLLRFISREVPDILKPAYNFGGISLTQLIEPYVTRWLKTVDAVNRLISTFSIVNLQTDLSQLLQGGPDGLIQRLQKFIRDRDNQNVFVTDKERETLELLTVQLSGLSELQAQAQEHQAAPTHLPLVVLTGITPAGLNASSESEIEVFHDWIHSVQQSLIRPRLDVMFRVVQLHLWGRIDPDITFDFVPLKELTGEALSRVKKTQAEMDATYVDLGAIDAQEVRQRIASDPDSGYNNLDVNKEIAPPIDEPDDEPREHGELPETAEAEDD